MKKILTYILFIIATLLVIVIFLTSKNYYQLIAGVILYPLVIYFALKIFPRKRKVIMQTPQTRVVESLQSDNKTIEEKKIEREKVEVADIDKRTFIKLIGAAGLSFFIFSILGRRIDSLLFGGNNLNNQSSPNSVGASSPLTPDGQPTDGYRITDVDNGEVSYFGFTDQFGAWLIMRQDTQTSSFRYAKGNSGFASGWSKRQNLTYDYYYNLF